MTPAPAPRPGRGRRSRWEGHDRGRLRADQIGPFLRSVIASGERLSEEDIRDIEAAAAAAPVTDAGLREEELDEGRLGLALHRIYCQQNAPMHSEPHHSAKRIAAEYAALSRQAEKETA